MIYQFKDFIPVIHPSAFIHPMAVITGNVEIGRDVYVGPGAAIRGDFGRIGIGDGSNVQENCVIHTFPGAEAILGKDSHIGHGAVLHGCFLAENCLVGINAVIMDEVMLGRDSIVGALSFLPQRRVYLERSLLRGQPAEVVGEVSDDMLKWKTDGTKIYQQLARDMKKHWKECEPLTESVERRLQDKTYQPRKKK